MCQNPPSLRSGPGCYRVSAISRTPRTNVQYRKAQDGYGCRSSLSRNRRGTAKRPFYQLCNRQGFNGGTKAGSPLVCGARIAALDQAMLGGQDYWHSTSFVPCRLAGGIGGIRQRSCHAAQSTRAVCTDGRFPLRAFAPKIRRSPSARSQKVDLDQL